MLARKIIIIEEWTLRDACRGRQPRIERHGRRKACGERDNSYGRQTKKKKKMNIYRNRKRVYRPRTHASLFLILAVQRTAHQ